MSRYSWIAPSYGYLVCLVAVITLLVNVSGFVDAMFDRANPLRSRNGMGPMGVTLTSFEAYQASADRAAPTRSERGAPADTLTTAQQRERYLALRADRIEQGRFESAQRMAKHGLLIVLALVLFATHWMWLRRQREPVAA